MQEKSLESTEIFKIFWGSIPPYPPLLVSHAFATRYFALNILCLRTPFNETQLRACISIELIVFIGLQKEKELMIHFKVIL